MSVSDRTMHHLPCDVQCNTNYNHNTVTVKFDNIVHSQKWSSRFCIATSSSLLPNWEKQNGSCHAQK